MDAKILSDLAEWLKPGHRQVIITLGGYGTSPEFYSIHVHDYDLNIGQDIKRAEEIDLMDKKKRQIEALRRKADKMEREVEDYGDTSQESS
jgi:hypothetical protein